MDQKTFPVIDPVATGANIARLRIERGLSVRDLQIYFGFEEPQAIYKWQKGKSLPSVDHLYALGALLEVPMEEILVSTGSKLYQMVCEQQAEACCSPYFVCRLFCPAAMDAAEAEGHTGHFPLCAPAIPTKRSTGSALRHLPQRVLSSSAHLFLMGQIWRCESVGKMVESMSLRKASSRGRQKKAMKDFSGIPNRTSSLIRIYTTARYAAL